jgi:hypothetical protein
MDKEAIAAELLRRGVPPEKIAEAGYPEVAQMGRAGMIAPRLQGPDKIATRGAYIRDYDKLSKRRETLGRYYGDTTDLARFHDLNTRVGSGGLENNLPILKDYMEWSSPERQEMSGIASKLQGKARVVGSGATSDFEQRLYRMGVPSPEKTGPTNDSIINYMRGVIQEESDRTAFDEEFIRRNGSLSGSQEAWARYVSAHPYTVTGKGGRSTPNAKRQDWRVYFGLSRSAGAPPPSITTGAPRVGGADDPLGIRGR